MKAERSRLIPLKSKAYIENVELFIAICFPSFFLSFIRFQLRLPSSYYAIISEVTAVTTHQANQSQFVFTRKLVSC